MESETTNGRSTFGDDSAAVWHPRQAHCERSRLNRAMKRWGYDSLAELHKASVRKPEWFWPAVVEDLEIPLSGNVSLVCDEANGREFPRWFPGALINIVDSCVERHAASEKQRQREACVYEGDNGQRRSLTFAELKSEVDLFAGALKRLGVGVGDRVALFMPPLPEASVATLAAAKLGAVIVPAFSGYGAEPLAARLNAAEACILVTADSTTRKGKPVPMKAIADDACAMAPSIRNIIVVTNSGESVNMSAGRDHSWDDLRQGLPDHEAPLLVDPNHPLFILYTSGTTGSPKGIVHSHLGFLLKSSLDFGYAFDLQADDVLGWISDLGWMLGPMMIVAGLHLGSTIVMIEGLPDFPNTERMWQVAERNCVTVLGVSPTAARGLRAKMTDAGPAADLSHVRAFTSTGEAWDLPTWHWLFENVGGRRNPILNYSGGTETGGGILSCYTITPQAPASFSGPLLGMDVDIFDSDGRSTSDIGELVIRNTWPGMTHGFWRADDRYLDTYYGRWPTIWQHGDLASVDENGFWHIHGRSDDTLKIGGRRVGPAEIESALTGLPPVAEAAVIGVPDPLRGQRIVAFVSLRENQAITAQELLTDITVAVGKGMAPAALYVVPGLPKTRNGKIMRRVIRSRYLGEPLGDLSSLDPGISLDVIPVLSPAIPVS